MKYLKILLSIFIPMPKNILCTFVFYYIIYPFWILILLVQDFVWGDLAKFLLQVFFTGHFLGTDIKDKLFPFPPNYTNSLGYVDPQLGKLHAHYENVLTTTFQFIYVYIIISIIIYILSKTRKRKPSANIFIEALNECGYLLACFFGVVVTPLKIIITSLWAPLKKTTRPQNLSAWKIINTFVFIYIAIDPLSFFFVFRSFGVDLYYFLYLSVPLLFPVITKFVAVKLKKEMKTHDLFELSLFAFIPGIIPTVVILYAFPNSISAASTLFIFLKIFPIIIFLPLFCYGLKTRFFNPKESSQ